MSEAFRQIKKINSFIPPTNWHCIKTIEMHTGGEPLRVITDGFPPLEGTSVLEYRNFVKVKYDHLRRALMHEPRGHADMYGCLLVPPNDEGADFGILFLHNEGYSTMCGHAIIAITTLAVEMKWVSVNSPETVVKIDAPCGRITAFATVKDGRVEEVAFHCVPSFVLGLGEKVVIPGLGELVYDLAYGGAFYAYVAARQIPILLIKENYGALIDLGRRIKAAVQESGLSASHPFEKDLSFLYGTILIGDPVSAGLDSRNVCIFAEGEVDRCPTGSGVAGRMALHFAKGELAIGEEMRIESITGSVFSGSVVETCSYGPHEAVIPRISGNAFITGQNEFYLDPADPFKEGFFLR